MTNEQSIYPEIRFEGKSTKEVRTLCKQRLSADPNDYEALFALAYLEPYVEVQLRVLEQGVLRVNPTHIRGLTKKAQCLEILSGSINPKHKGKQSDFLEQSVKTYRRILELVPEEQREIYLLEAEDVFEEYRKKIWKGPFSNS